MNTPSSVDPPTEPHALDPARWPYFCWCVCLGAFRFAYVYGPTVQCDLVVAHEAPENCLKKGGSPTLDQARERAEVLAGSLAETYRGIGTAQAVPAADFILGRHRAPF